MKLICKSFFAISLIVLFSFCDKSQKKTSTFLEIYFLDPGLKFPMNINCQALRSEMLKERVKYKLINNEDSLKFFILYYNQLKNDTAQFNFDVKIQLIYHHYEKIDTICMGSNFNISVNGEKKQESKVFHDFIRRNIY